MTQITRRLALTGLIVAALVAIGAVAFAQESAQESAEEPVVPWLGVELTDIRTGDTFPLAQFADKPILLETFAVWCPTCTSQQRQLAALHEEVGDAVISVTLNTDPNETQSQVVRHLDRHGFDWLFAVSPVDLSRSLRDEFGVAVLNPPSAPVILICPGQTERTLLQKRGVKRPDFLQEQIAACPAVDEGGSASA
ncbi:MAG: redoxin family protein [Spirochaetaceae bacterium]|nr:redoxin family protein [Spirochaetaceae bacterium]